MIQKLIKVGNSRAIIISRSFVKKLKLKAGHIVYSDVDEFENTITFYFRKPDYLKAQKENIKFRKTVRDFNMRYKDILSKLSSQ